jgi:D-glycerate 3-kinase
MANGAQACIDRLIAREKLPQSYRRLIDACWRPLAAQIASWRREAGRAIVVGVNGGQGSGKTTLCRFLEECLFPELGLSAVTVALDDFYLPKADRAALAKSVHPLFATRGVPGTHDVAAMTKTLAALKAGRQTTLPVFDKSADDRAAQGKRIDGAPDIILFEGWCVGAAPQTEGALNDPVNALERDEDPDRVWRRYANEKLRTEYADAFALIDRLVMLRAPDMETILRNRQEQERKLRESRPSGAGVMSDAAVVRFVQFYERLTRWMLAEMPARAAAVYDLADLRRLQDA